MVKKTTLITAWLVALAGLAPGMAAAGDSVYGAGEWPLRLVDRPLVLAPGMLEVRGDTVLIELSSGAVGDPISLAPDLYYGINEKVTVGVIHDIGICISGDGCASTYSDVGVDFFYSLLHGGTLQLAGHMGFQAPAFEPFTGGVTAGMAAQLGIGNAAVVLDPRIYVAVFGREQREEVVDVPVQVQYQLTEQNALVLTTGMRSTISGFGDAVEVPIGFGALFAISHRFDVGGELLFPNLAGAGATASRRQLIFRAALRI